LIWKLQKYFRLENPTLNLLTEPDGIRKIRTFILKIEFYKIDNSLDCSPSRK